MLIILEWHHVVTFTLIPTFQVKIAYINFLNHCYVDTEVEMKEIYTSNHMWKLFENFLVDICRVRNIRRLQMQLGIIPSLKKLLRNFVMIC